MKKFLHSASFNDPTNFYSLVVCYCKKLNKDFSFFFDDPIILKKLLEFTNENDEDIEEFLNSYSLEDIERLLFNDKFCFIKENNSSLIKSVLDLKADDHLALFSNFNHDQHLSNYSANVASETILLPDPDKLLLTNIYRTLISFKYKKLNKDRYSLYHANTVFDFSKFIYFFSGRDLRHDPLNFVTSILENPNFKKGIFLAPVLNIAANVFVTTLLKEHLLEGVIRLQNGFIEGSSKVPYLLIISKDNDSVKFIDAKNLATVNNDLTYDSIKTILDSYANSNDLCFTVDYTLIKSNNFSLNPTLYNNSFPYEKFDFLTDLCTITRGRDNLIKTEFEKRLSDTPTNYKWLTTSDISDNFDISNLQSLTHINPNEFNNCVNNGDIVISRFFNKQAIIIEKPADISILVNGTVYIIKVNTDRIDKYYLLNFFKSNCFLRQYGDITDCSLFVSRREFSVIKVPRFTKEKEDEISSKFFDVLKRRKALLAELEELANLEKSFL